MMYSYPLFPHFYTRPFFRYLHSPIANAPQNGTTSFNNTDFKNRQHNANIGNQNKNRVPTLNRTQQNADIKKEERYSSKERKAETDKEEEVLFEILGIKLHSDDILLLCLIFFLYNEGVKDEFLFIALILLLLS